MFKTTLMNPLFLIILLFSSVCQLSEAYAQPAHQTKAGVVAKHRNKAGPGPCEPCDECQPCCDGANGPEGPGGPAPYSPWGGFFSQIAGAILSGSASTVGISMSASASTGIAG